jgi:hypothetical protein
MQASGEHVISRATNAIRKKMIACKAQLDHKLLADFTQSRETYTVHLTSIAAGERIPTMRKMSTLNRSITSRLTGLTLLSKT